MPRLDYSKFKSCRFHVKNVGDIRGSVYERIVRKSVILPDGCVVWTGSLRGGYGRVGSGGRYGSKIATHRAMWEYYIGPIPEGLEPDHTCKNHACWAINHLELVTHQVNVLRGDAPTAVNARKTHCIHNHEFTPENTYRQNGGGRGCLICRRATQKRYDNRKRASRGQSV